MLPSADIAPLQGTLYVLILKVLALQPMHGLGISRRIAPVTNATFLVKPEQKTDNWGCISAAMEIALEIS